MSDNAHQLQRAARLLQDQRFEQAEALCRAMLADSAAQADALHLLALIRKQRGDLAGAEGLMRQSIQAQPDRADFQANLGNLLHVQRRAAQACDAYRAALALDPRHGLARLGLARAYIEVGDFVQAERECQTALQQRANDAQVWSTLATALRRLGRFADAESAYRRAIQIQPAYGAAHHNLGALLAEMDRAEEALAALDRAQALGIAAKECALNRGHALLKLYRLSEAEQAYEQAVKVQAQDIDAQRSLARLRFMRGDPSFMRSVEAAIVQHPEAIGLHLLLVELARDAGDLARAEHDLRKVIARWGGAPSLRSALSSVLMNAGRLNDAEREASQAAMQAPDHPAIVENLICVQLLLSRPEEALTWIRRFRVADPNEQRWIAYESTAARLLRNPLYQELYDYDAYVRTYEVQPPAGWRSIEEFNLELDQVLSARHRFAQHPLDQSLRHGSQTARSLLADADPLIKAVLKQFEEPLLDYAASVGAMRNHPLALRNQGPPVIDKCWSVQLRREGFHVNHIHPQGWISSAYYVAVPPETEDTASASGWIKFGEPKLPIPDCTPERQIQPRSGRLVLFPSYMWHGTTPIHGAVPRTTIAFDAVPEGERRR